MFHVILEKIHILLLMNRVFYKYYLSWLMVLFRSSVSLAIFCTLVLTITDRGVLNFYYILDLSISPCIFIRFDFVYFEALLLGA